MFLDWIEACGRGRIDSFSVVARQILPELLPPYVVARVRLEEGPILLTNISAPDHAHLECDQPVEVTWRALADGRALPTFVPTSAS